MQIWSSRSLPSSLSRKAAAEATPAKRRGIRSSAVSTSSNRSIRSASDIVRLPQNALPEARVHQLPQPHNVHRSAQPCLQVLFQHGGPEEVGGVSIEYDVHVALLAGLVARVGAKVTEREQMVFLGVLFFEGLQQGLQSCGLQNRVTHITTSIMVMVSLPKMSTTFTASLRRPGGHSWKTLVSSSVRSLLVRNDCHSFSKT